MSQTYKRIILEMGMGVDLYGEDYTKAATRAISDALRHSSLTLFRSLNIDHGTMKITLVVGVQNPEAINAEALKKEIPFGEVTVNTEVGGMNVVDKDNDTTTVIASVAVVAHLPLDGSRYQVSSNA